MQERSNLLDSATQELSSSNNIQESQKGNELPIDAPRNLQVLLADGDPIQIRRQYIKASKIKPENKYRTLSFTEQRKFPCTKNGASPRIARILQYYNTANGHEPHDQPQQTAGWGDQNVSPHDCTLRLSTRTKWR